MKVGDVMTSQVRTVFTTDPVSLAMRMMLEGGFSGVPVIDERGRLAGMLTEGDLLRRAELGTEQRHPHWLEFVLGPGRLAKEYVDVHARRVEQLMTADVASVSESTPLAEAVDLMEKRHVKRLPVLREGKLVGILSRSDLMRAFLMATQSNSVACTAPDDGIRQCIEREMARQPWNPHATVRILVHQGVVDLDGVIISDNMREALCVLAENVPGVVNVNDRLTTIEPTTGYIVRSPEDAHG